MDPSTILDLIAELPPDILSSCDRLLRWMASKLVETGLANVPYLNTALAVCDVGYDCSGALRDVAEEVILAILHESPVWDILSPVCSLIDSLPSWAKWAVSEGITTWHEIVEGDYLAVLKRAVSGSLLKFAATLIGYLSGYLDISGRLKELLPAWAAPIVAMPVDQIGSAITALTKMADDVTGGIIPFSAVGGAISALLSGDPSAFLTKLSDWLEAGVDDFLELLGF